MFTSSFALLPNGRDRLLGLAMAPWEAYLDRAHAFSAVPYGILQLLPFRVCRVFGLGVNCRNAKDRENSQGNQGQQAAQRLLIDQTHKSHQPQSSILENALGESLRDLIGLPYQPS